MKTRRSQVLMLVGAVLVAGTVGTFALSNRSADEVGGVPSLAQTPASPAHSASLAHSPAPDTQLGELDPSTLDVRATFASRVGDVRVSRAQPLRGSTLAKGVRGDDDRKGRKDCVLAEGEDFRAYACKHQPFAKAHLLLIEVAAGGPAKRDRTEFQLVGVTSGRVARVTAVDSEGATHEAELNRGAFLLELSKEALAAGVEIETLSAISPSGSVLETVEL